MPVHELGPNDGLYFEHRLPSAARGVTFTFFNALTGDTLAWETMIAPALWANGHGEKDSPFGEPGASGLQDRVFYDAGDVAELRARLPDAQTVDLPDVGHLVSMGRAQAVVDACLALVERLR